jgi:hypothetical protein
MAVAVFNTDTVVGEAVVEEGREGVRLKVRFSVLPPGKHVSLLLFHKRRVPYSSSR